MTRQSENPENFDYLLDQALQSYSSTRPSPGLEERILAHVTSECAAYQWRTRNLLWFATAALALATALTLIVLSTRPVQKQQQFARNVPIPSIGGPQERPAPRVQRVIVHAAQPLHRSTRPASKPQYGQPQSTRQDLLLVEFVALHRQDALNLAKQQQNPDRPIPDKPIADAPLHVDPIVSNPIVIAPIAMDSKDQASF